LKDFRFYLLTLLAFGPGAFFCQAQELVANIKGLVADQVTQARLEGVLVILTDMDGKALTTVTNSDGRFDFGVTPGRYVCEVSVLGYGGGRQEVLAISGRTTAVSFSLTEMTTELEGVTVTARVPDADEEIVLPIEKVLRMPANFFDPVRMLSSYPNVVAANDQANNIIVKGSSPSGLLWRLNGMDIVNPNHLANAGTINDKPTANGGGVNILSAQMLDKTSFYSGHIPARYGNFTSGVLDMNLREGSTRRNEFTAQASVLGLDFSAEGPLGKSGGASYLANYRYSTVGLLSAFGVNFGGEAITFQDLSFHLRSKVGATGSISFFGLGGLSSNKFRATLPPEWERDKDRFDIFYKSNMGALGTRYEQRLGSFNLSAGATISSTEQSRESSSYVTPQYPLQESSYASNRTLISSFASLAGSVSDAVTFDAGVMVNFTHDILFSEERLPDQPMLTLADNNADFVLLQPYAQVRARVDKFSAELGGRYLAATLEDAQSLDYRVELNYDLTSTMSLGLSGGQVSQLPQPGVYLIDGNNDLGFMHKQFAEFAHVYQRNKWKFTSTAYYHYFTDVPIDPLENFSVLNMMDGVAFANLTPSGTGVNKGVSLQAERSFLSSFYVLAGASYYNSTFSLVEGVNNPTRFNGRYSLLTTAGYERSKDVTDARKAFGVHGRFMWLGGLRENPVDVDNSRAAGVTVYDSTQPYATSLKDYYRVDLRLSWRKDKGRYTRTVAVDIQNLAGLKNEAYHYFDILQDQVVTQYQVGIIPVIVYRIDF
jgi:hypothetical protein